MLDPNTLNLARLPDEVIITLLAAIEPKELCRAHQFKNLILDIMATTSKRFASLVTSNALWKLLSSQRWNIQSLQAAPKHLEDTHLIPGEKDGSYPPRGSFFVIQSVHKDCDDLNLLRS